MKSPLVSDRRIVLPGELAAADRLSSTTIFDAGERCSGAMFRSQAKAALKNSVCVFRSHVKTPKPKAAALKAAALRLNLETKARRERAGVKV